MDLVARAMEMQQRHRVEMWHADPAEPRNIERFRRADLRAVKADNRVMVGISAVSARIRTGRLRVFRGCKNLIYEAGLYRWPTPEERRVSGEEPIDENNHACSALRYMVQGIDRLTQVWREEREPEPEPPEPVDFEQDYTKSPPKEGPKQVRLTGEDAAQLAWEQSDEARRLQREYLESTWEAWRGFDGASGP
jgi:hypothetical protein